MKKIVEELLAHFRPDNEPFTEDGFYKILEQSVGDHTWQKAVFEKLNQLNNIVTFQIYRIHYNDDYPDNSMDLGDVYHPTMPPAEIPDFIVKAWHDHGADQDITDFVDLLETKFGFVETNETLPDEEIITVEIE